MIPALLRLGCEWTVGERLGSGGFSEVYLVSGAGSEAAVAKFVPKEPGAERELLFVDLTGVRNIVPVIDSGDDENYWVLVMPRADLSLRDRLKEIGSCSIDEAIAVLGDVCDALIDLDGRVVHRDLKPENVLRLDNHWCLADFGISRYAESATAQDTRKYALTPPYAAPERWRAERATSAADIYSLGLIGYELLTGVLPLVAQSAEDWRDAHLHGEPVELDGVPTPMATLLEECLYKSPQARPTPANFRARLSRYRSQLTTSAGLAELAETNYAEVQRRTRTERDAAQARSEAERRTALAEAAERSLRQILGRLLDDLTATATSATVHGSRGLGWTLRLNGVDLTTADSGPGDQAWGGWTAPPFDVVSCCSVNLRIPVDRHGYEGRSHSLWFGDIQEAGAYAWYETAFMVSPIMPRRGRQAPFSLPPGESAAKAVWAGMSEFQVAWPFTRLDPDDLTAFVSRWAGWLAAAAAGRLTHPSTLPELSPEGSWRRT